jgi:hypothetical protein
MTLVRYFKPDNRLAKAVTLPGGKLVETAVDDARIELLQVSDACLQEIDAALDHTYRLCETPPAGDRLPELYTTVRDVAGLAGVCALPDLGAAALSFCALLDHAQNGGRLAPDHVAVHLNVLRILRHPDAIPEDDRCKVLESLDVMVGRIAQKAPPSLDDAPSAG